MLQGSRLHSHRANSAVILSNYHKTLKHSAIIRLLGVIYKKGVYSSAHTNHRTSTAKRIPFFISITSTIWTKNINWIFNHPNPPPKQFKIHHRPFHTDSRFESIRVAVTKWLLPYWRSSGSFVIWCSAQCTTVCSRSYDIAIYVPNCLYFST